MARRKKYDEDGFIDPDTEKKEESGKGWIIFFVILVIVLIAKCSEVTSQSINNSTTINKSFEIEYNNNSKDSVFLSNLSMVQDVCLCKDCYKCLTQLVIKRS